MIKLSDVPISIYSKCELQYNNVLYSCSYFVKRPLKHCNKLITIQYITHKW